MDDARAASPVPPMRPLKERQAAERAALILEAAGAIFSEKGYHDAAVADIAARVGISKGAVYLHFASKDELLEALVEHHITRFLAIVDSISAQPTTVRDRLEQIFAWVYGLMDGEQIPLLLELGVIGLAARVLNRRPALNAQIERALERIAALLDEGKRTGELDSTVPTPILVALFSSLLSPYGIERLLASGAVSAEELVSHVSRMFFTGLLPPTPLSPG